jgi:hypothetical protein
MVSILCGWVLVFVSLCAADVDPYTPYDDFHYPTEEPAELKTAKSSIPSVISITNGHATVEIAGKPQDVTPGDKAGDWSIQAILESRVVMERDFKRWGLLVFAAAGSNSLTILRKSIGDIKSIRQPRFNFSSLDSNYWDNVKADPTDLPSKLAINHTSDKEMTYASVAATLAPQRDYASVS